MKKIFLVVIIILISLFSFTSLPQNDECNGLKIGIIGASNTATDYSIGSQPVTSYVDFIREKCPEVFVAAAAGFSPKGQLEQLFPRVLSQNPEIIIFSPEGNKVCIPEEHQIPLEQMILEANGRGIKTIVLTVSPRGSDESCVNTFNSKLFTKSGYLNKIDYVVDIFKTLGDPLDLNKCGYCITDGVHWTTEGDKKVAEMLLQLLIYEGETKSGTIRRGSTNTDLPSSAESSCISPDCLQIDNVWSQIRGLLGSLEPDLKDKIWDPQAKWVLPSVTTPAVHGVAGACTLPIDPSKVLRFNSNVHTASTSGHGVVRTDNGLAAVDLSVGENADQAYTNAQQGIPVISPISGIIAEQFNLGDGSGNCVIITDFGKMVKQSANAAVLCHINYQTNIGQSIAQGQVVGSVTAYSDGEFGPHLHLEIKLNNQWITGDGLGGTWENIRRTCSGKPGSGSQSVSSLDNGGIKNDINQGKYTPEFVNKVDQISKELSLNPLHLFAIMDYETGGTFNPAVENRAGSGAVGLIQFAPSTAKSLETTTEVLSKMPQLGQLEYVKKYFKINGFVRLTNFEDVAMAVFYPAGIGKDDGEILIKTDAGKKYTNNQNLDTDNNGISRGEYLQKAKESAEKYGIQI